MVQLHTSHQQCNKQNDGMLKRFNYRVTVSLDKYRLVDHINMAAHSHTGNDERYSLRKTVTLWVP